MEKSILRKLSLALILAVASLLLGCGHDRGGVLPPPFSPASYTYTAKLVATHQPGFFSCANWNGRILLGTYQDYSNRMHCQLCELVGNQVRVIHTFDGESVYHIRAFKDYVILPIEQGGLFRYDASGVHRLRGKKYHMGFYDFTWLNGHSYALEKANIDPPNMVAVYRDLHEWFFSTGWKAKDMVASNGKLYFSATGLHNHTEAAIVEVDSVTKRQKVFKSYRWCWSGGLAVYDNAVWMTLDNGLVVNTRGEEYKTGAHAWYVGEIGGTLFATSGGRWRGKGPGALWMFNSTTRQFEKKLDLPDAELWFMCRAGEDKYYLVTRNEKGNLGRIYLIERK